MKRILLTLTLCLAASSIALRAADNDTTVCFTVNPPMSCVNCENKIKSNLRFEKGVKEIDASAKDALVTVKFDKKKTSVDKLNKAFKKIGYDSQAVEAKTTDCKKHQSGCKHHDGQCGKGQCDKHAENNGNCCKK